VILVVLYLIKHGDSTPDVTYDGNSGLLVVDMGGLMFADLVWPKRKIEIKIRETTRLYKQVAGVL
jgi:hypothetical protein